MDPSLIALVVSVAFIAAGSEFQTRRRHRRIAKDVRALFAPTKWTKANPADAPALNTPGIKEAIDALGDEGFRLLGDVKATRATQVSQVRVLSDGQSSVAIHTTGSEPNQQVVVQVEAELTDGRVLRVIRGLAAPALDEPPEVTRIDVRELSPTALLATYRNEMEKWASETQTRSEQVRFGSLEDVLASQIRQEVVRAAHRSAVGLTRDEAVRLVGEGGAKGLLKELQRQREALRPF
ncbi:MAG: hypothetical protein ACI9KE_003905 [Polyangiales bacterium]|jgi:hypothetical protein